MKDIFYPTSVAVVGVSSDPENLGRNIMLNLIGCWRNAAARLCAAR